MSKRNRFLAAALLAIAMAVYLPSLFVYLVHPQQWWLMGIISIGFPYTWMGVLLLAILTWRWNKKIAGVLLICWMMGLPVMRNVFALGKAAGFETTRDATSLRVMQWNCMDLPGGDTAVLQYRSVRKEFRALMQQYQPDVLLLEDYSTIEHGTVMSNHSFIKDSLGFRYVVFNPYFQLQEPWGLVQQGVAIFSKKPLQLSGSFRFTGRRYPELVSWADIVHKGKPVRLTVAHLLSMQLNRETSDAPKLAASNKEDSLLIAAGELLPKLKTYQPYHVKQAKELRQFLDTCSVPAVLGADLNSVPSSWVYHHIRGSMGDVFLKTGFGFGRTYTHWLPNLRIDYLFTAPGVQVKQATIVPVWFSDHAAIIADLDCQ